MRVLLWGSEAGDHQDGAGDFLPGWLPEPSCGGTCDE